MLRSVDFNRTTGMWLASAKEATERRNLVTDLLQARRRGHREPAVPQELHHLPAHLQLGEVAVQVDPVQTVQIELTCPSSTSLTVTGLTRTRRDAMTTSATRRYENRACTHGTESTTPRPPRRYQAKPAWMIDSRGLVVVGR